MNNSGSIRQMVSLKHARNYLDKLCHKVNMRNYGEQLFDRLLIACVTSNYKNMVNHYR